MGLVSHLTVVVRRAKNTDKRRTQITNYKYKWVVSHLTVVVRRAEEGRRRGDKVVGSGCKGRRVVKLIFIFCY